MIKFSQFIAEAPAQTNFDTYSAALNVARETAEKKGFEVSDDDWFDQVNNGPKKPSAGKTVRHNLALTKNGKPTRKGLAIQVYNRGTDKNPFELNFYIS